MAEAGASGANIPVSIANSTPCAISRWIIFLPGSTTDEAARNRLHHRGLQPHLSHHASRSRFSAAGAGKDADRGAGKAEGAPNLVFQKPLIGEVQLDGAIGEQHKSGGRHRGLRHVVNFHPLSHGDGGTLEIHLLEKAVHGGGGNAFAALLGHGGEDGKNLLHVLAGGSGNENYRRILQELQRAAHLLLVKVAVHGPLLLSYLAPAPALQLFAG